MLLSRSSKPQLAQLMRIHVVTPKAPVHVTLHPKIQPAPEPCPTFFPTLNEPLKLSQSAYWVLRLPYPFILCWIFSFSAKVCFSDLSHFLK